MQSQSSVIPSPSHPGRRAAAARTRNGDRARPGRRPRRQRRLLARYADSQGRCREIVVRPGRAGSVLVVDRDAASDGDQRLLAHLSPEEPAENAALVCSDYLERLRRSGECGFRAVVAEDAQALPLAEEELSEPRGERVSSRVAAVDARGCSYRLRYLQTRMSIPQLRWCRDGGAQESELSLREAIACIESYEPLCSLTARALAIHRGDADVSTTTLRAEFARVRESPIVLNRGLREVVLAAVGRGELSMSEIAIRCGRIKRDGNGNESGETSWLARRLGLLPEGGHSTPTPWIHSDVLGLIARRGLGISPREVELT